MEKRGHLITVDDDLLLSVDSDVIDPEIRKSSPADVRDYTSPISLQLFSLSLILTLSACLLVWRPRLEDVTSGFEHNLCARITTV